MESDYRDLTGLSQSDLKLFARDPHLYWETCITGERPRSEPTPAMQFGIEVEHFLFNGQPPADWVRIPDDALTKDGHRRGNRWKAFEREHAGKRLLKPGEWAARVGPLQEIARRVAQTPLAQRLLAASEKHKVVQWELQGRKCKAQLDLWLPKLGLVCDLKTTASNSLQQFARQAWDYGYDLQAYWYLMGVEMASGIQCDFCWLTVQTSPSYQVEVIQVTQEWLESGRAKAEKYLAALAEAEETGRWESPTWDKLANVELPKWARV